MDLLLLFLLGASPFYPPCDSIFSLICVTGGGSVAVLVVVVIVWPWLVMSTELIRAYYVIATYCTVIKVTAGILSLTINDSANS